MSSLPKIPVSLLFIFSSLFASGACHVDGQYGASGAGRGYVGVMKKDFRSVFRNPASLAFNKSFIFCVGYDDRFLLRELATRSGCLAVPAGKTSLGALFTRFGYADFKCTTAGLASGIRLSDILAAGVQVDFMSERSSAGYYNYQVLTCETGVIITPDDKTSIGIMIINPVPNSLRKESMPTLIRAGAGTCLNSSLFAGVEAEMSTENSLVIKTGFEYEMFSNFIVRGGFISENNSFTFGLGYGINNVMADIGFVVHDRLGLSTGVSLIFKIR